MSAGRSFVPRTKFGRTLEIRTSELISRHDDVLISNSYAIAPIAGIWLLLSREGNVNVCMAVSIFKLLDKGMDNRPDTVAYGLADLPQRLFDTFCPMTSPSGRTPK